MKTCERCLQEAPHYLFRDNRRLLGGKDTVCKDCRKAYEKKYRAKNRDKINAKKRAYRKEAGGEAGHVLTRGEVILQRHLIKKKVGELRAARSKNGSPTCARIYPQKTRN